MKKIQPVDPVQRQEFLAWYHASAPGKALQSLESSYLASELEFVYNSHTLQLGWLGSEASYLPADARGQFVIASNHPSETTTFERVCSGASSLPFATESIDTLILAHVLEFEPDRHQVLREVERVLKPEGILLVLGLNPLYPRRWLQLPKRGWLWNAKPVPGWQLLDWLSLLNFDASLETRFGKATQYNDGEASSLWNKLRSGLATGYAIKAIKRNFRLIPIEPDWIQLSRMMAGGLLETSRFLKHDDHDRPS